MMTRQHFELIARIIRQLQYEGFQPNEIRAIAEVFVSTLKRTNPNFDEDRFLAAATLDSVS